MRGFCARRARRAFRGSVRRGIASEDIERALGTCATPFGHARKALGVNEKNVKETRLA